MTFSLSADTGWGCRGIYTTPRDVGSTASALRSWRGIRCPQGRKEAGQRDFRGVKLSNETHRSSTDPEALLARKSNAHPAQLSYRGHVLMENRHDLVVDCRVTLADGYGERDAAQEMAADCPAGVPSSVKPPVPPPRRSRGGTQPSCDRLSGWRCKGWAGPFPWFENHLNQTNHAQDPLCRT